MTLLLSPLFLLIQRPVPIVLAAILSIVIGFVWYGPLFGATWKRLAKPAGGSMLQSLSTHAALAVVQAAIFARFFQYWRLSSVIQAIIIAALLWLAFVVPSFVVNGVYAGRSRTLLAIESAYFLLTLEAMALVFAWLL